MYHLLAAVLVFAFGTATSLATARGLQDWAISKFDTELISSAGDIAERRRKQIQQ
jgi:hypothetical protein